MPEKFSRGTPEQLFKKPVNKFVAGFLGTPPMNFLDATVSAEGDAQFLTGKNFKLKCDEQTRQRLANASSRELVLGIRPSDLLYDASATSENVIEVNVVVSEYIGAQSVLIGDCGGEKVMVELKSDTPVKLGEKLSFQVDLNEIHFFDVSDGQAIG